MTGETKKIYIVKWTESSPNFDRPGDNVTFRSMEFDNKAFLKDFLDKSKYRREILAIVERTIIDSVISPESLEIVE